MPVALAEALGLVLADDVVARLALPVFDNSAMDGYAVRAEETSDATPEHPVVLPVAEDIPAGRTDELTLQPDTAHRIMTGAPVPAGTTAVVPVEDTDGGVDSVAIRKPRQPGAHIRRAGEDVAAGTTVLREGQVVTPAVLGLAVGAGTGRADGDPPPTGAGDLHRVGARGAGQSAAAGADLRVQLDHAGRRRS